MTTTRPCPCGAAVRSPSDDEFADEFLAHVRGDHPDWPYPDGSVRNVGDALVRLRPPGPRLDEVGALTTVALGPDVLDDWLRFFDVEAFAGDPVNASCYCLEPFESRPPEVEPWRDRRAAMVEHIETGRAFGYLAYDGDLPVGWVNASWLTHQVLYQAARTALVDDPADVIAVTCFAIRPEHRQHGVAALLLDRVVADGPGRGAASIEGYPFRVGRGQQVPGAGFRGSRTMFEDRGFERIEVRERDSVMRLDLS